MAYPNYPQNYNPYYGQQMPPQAVQQPAQQIQNGGFIPVPSEEVARNYPVAPGNSVTFKNENAPYVYTKTMGFSQLDRPIFEKYKLVREDSVPVVTEHSDKEIDYNKEFEEIQEQIAKLWRELDVLKESPRKNATLKKREVSED